MNSAPDCSNAAMLVRASSRAVSRSPACACNAPQHRWPSAAHTPYPFRASVRSVARFTGANNPSITHPSSIATRPRVVSAAGYEAPASRRVASSVAIRLPIRPGARASRRESPLARTTRAAAMATAISHGWANVARTTRDVAGSGRAPDVSARVCSSNCPYGTPEGQAVSQARQPRH